MNFIEKYTVFYEIISKTPKKKNIRIILKFFESPTRKILQIVNHALIFSDQIILNQPCNFKKNKLTITEKIFLSINPNLLTIVKHMKKNPILKNKLKESVG